MKTQGFIVKTNNVQEIEFITKLGLNAGYRSPKTEPNEPLEPLYESLHIAFAPREEGYFFFPPATSAGSNWNKSSGYKMLTFPSDYNEIVKLFEKEKEVEFKVGDLVKIIDFGALHAGKNFSIGSLYKLTEHNKNRIAFEKDDKGCNDNGWSHTSCLSDLKLVPATPQEIETELIKQAKEKGFVVGAKVDSKQHGVKGSIDAIKYFPNLTKGETSTAITNYKEKHGNHFLVIDVTPHAFPINECELLPSHPQIRINRHLAKFEDWGLDFNGGCAKIDKKAFQAIVMLMESLNNLETHSNKSITSVKIGAGEFTASQIKEIADYYNGQK